MHCMPFSFRLRAAKQAELRSWGVWRLQKDDVGLHISKMELERHCKRRTRGVDETTQLIKDLLDMFGSDRGRDTMGIPLFNKEVMQQIWKEQQRHIACIQDPVGVQLYTQTGSLEKGGVKLPIYRCARGSTSLESFHNHIDCFIPGNRDHYGYSDLLLLVNCYVYSSN